MEKQLLELRQEASQALKEVQTLEELQDLRVKYLGKKGLITQVLRGMGKLSAEERPRIGQLANEIRDNLETMVEAKVRELKEKEIIHRLETEKIDLTLPGRSPKVGNLHPLIKVQNELKEIFMGMGFSITGGPEVELDYYNFETLNIPKNHPARDMQDTFYVTDEVLLRTHNSPVQTRTLLSHEPNEPFRVIYLGKCYRRDDDATHSPVFHQVEAMAVGKGITFGDLKGTLITFAKQLFGEDRKVRFRPSYFPFTEPSAEVDISCNICGGKGCRTCKYSGWLEILGCGMVHSRVLEMGNYDPHKVSGFAIGMGLERMTMLKYGIDDLRLFFENDLRFLRQF